MGDFLHDHFRLEIHGFDTFAKFVALVRNEDLSTVRERLLHDAHTIDQSANAVGAAAHALDELAPEPSQP